MIREKYWSHFVQEELGGDGAWWVPEYSPLEVLDAEGDLACTATSHAAALSIALALNAFAESEGREGL